MAPWLLVALLSATASAKDNWFTRIRYAVGGAAHSGLGAHLGQASFVGEPAALEFRSYFSPRVASHTTLNLTRMVVGAAEGAPRLDYDLHLGFHVPLGDELEVVLAPGASIAYAPGASYARFVGDLRLGVDHPLDPVWTLGGYVRPFAGWQVGDDGAAGVTVGAAFEVVFIARIPRRAGRPTPTAPRPGA